MPYILEVQKYINETATHIGYMKKQFNEKREAQIYYDINNTHMRSLNKYNNTVSDWDPNTMLRYIIHEINDILTIDNFSNINL